MSKAKDLFNKILSDMDIEKNNIGGRMKELSVKEIIKKIEKSKCDYCGRVFNCGICTNLFLYCSKKFFYDNIHSPRA